MPAINELRAVGLQFNRVRARSYEKGATVHPELMRSLPFDNCSLHCSDK